MLRPKYRIGDDVYIRQVVDDVGGEPILEVTREKVVTVYYKDGTFFYKITGWVGHWEEISLHETLESALEDADVLLKVSK